MGHWCQADEGSAQLCCLFAVGTRIVTGNQTLRIPVVRMVLWAEKKGEGLEILTLVSGRSPYVVLLSC